MGTDFDKAVAHSILQTDREINICFIKRILSGSIVICLRKRTNDSGWKKKYSTLRFYIPQHDEE